jgi:homoserine dehydrogenase
MRIWLVGFGTVGRWLAGVLDEQAGSLETRYGLDPRVVGIATAHDGFVYAPDGLDLAGQGVLSDLIAVTRGVPALT